MKQQKFTNETNQIFIRAIPVLITSALALQLLLTGCANINHREESIDTILAKENVLIEKVKLERAQPDVSKAVNQSESLRKAEGHLLMALDEILKANEVVTTKLTNQTKREVSVERYEQNHR